MLKATIFSYMNRMVVRTGAVVFMAVLLCVPYCAAAQLYLQTPLHIPRAQIGALVEDVSIEGYGVLSAASVSQYLSVRPGARLEQAAINRDFGNLVRLGAYRTRLDVEVGSAPHSVRLRWILLSKWLRPTSHPFYTETPLTAPIQGVGFVLTSRPLDARGSTLSAYTQLSKRANLGRALFTKRLSVNPDSGTASSLIVDAFGGRGVFRASEPLAINVYSWSAGEEALFLTQRTNGTQFEGGVREVHTSNQLSSNLVAPSLYPTNVAYAKTTQLVAGLTHGCTSVPSQWYPPYCDLQYRISATDAIGGLAATSEYRVFAGDVVRYFDAGVSTIVVHASAVRSGGVIPDSFLLCATVRGYPKPFCGTDAEGATAEWRINDHKSPKIEWVVFTEDAASRVRQGISANALPFFSWHPDSGIGVIYHAIRFDLAGGKAGMRLTFELKGQLY